MTHPIRPRRRAALTIAGTALLAGLAACGSDDDGPEATQPDFGPTALAKLSVGRWTFKDLNKNGTLEPYEDWRLGADERAADLVARMTLAEKAGLMMHGTAPTNSTGYDVEGTRELILTTGINNMITRVSTDAKTMATQYNALQAIAEQSRLGIPLSISSDPRNSFAYVQGASVASGSFSKWPEPLGLAAVGDTALTKRHGDVARQEYLAVGITQALSPQADLATEPRWSRINGTFGEDAELAKAQVQAYIEGFQGGSAGLTNQSVVAVVKHWAGYGASKDGFDGHNYYGRHTTFPGSNFAYHLIPFEGAFAAKAGSVMPTYSFPDTTVTVDGVTLAAAGAAYDKGLLTDLLRGRYGFEGVVLSDWGITSDCDTNCINGFPAGTAPSFIGFGTPWGMESATKLQRYAKATDAGIDQFGGVTEPEYLVQAVQQGLLTEARIDQSVRRILLQKFQQGLFERPFVDADAAATVVGSAQFQAEALAAQQRALVLLKNDGKLLPMAAGGLKLWLYGIDAATAQSRGYTVVATPAEADVAVLRVSAPYETLHPNYIFGSFQHEGSLAYADGNADYEAIKAAAAAPRQVVTVYLDRPAILTNVQDKASAIVANFGVSDTALFDVLSGKAKPEGKLPFELPSSMAEVEAQREDVPHDTANPLYRFGAGLSY